MVSPDTILSRIDRAVNVAFDGSCFTVIMGLFPEKHDDFKFLYFSSQNKRVFTAIFWPNSYPNFGTTWRLIREATMPEYDFFQIDALLTEPQRALRDRVRDYVARVVWPNINPYWERAEFPHELARGLVNLGILGGQVQGYGCAGLDALSDGLVCAELARGDGSISTFFGVQSGLAIKTIAMLGDEAQRQRWLPGLARLDLIGAFGLTEPERGSDATHLLTTADRDGGDYVLNGAKRWIGNAALADVLIIWARDDADGLGAFVIEQPQSTEGLHIANIAGKISKRAVLNADIRLENVRVPVERRLVECRAVADLIKVLTASRYGVVWEAIGVAAGCYELALKYATERQQFGRFIAGFQLVQEKLVNMAAALTQMRLLGIHMARLVEAGQVTAGQMALAKYNNARHARAIAQLAREVLGGNGILLENHIARLFTDAEAVYTYEGSSDINLLVAGREITGCNAIA